MLYKHQTEFLKQNPNMTSLVWSCGTGKSRAAIEWTKLCPQYKPLVICPKSLKTNWKREAEKWGVEIVVMSKEEFRRDHDTMKKYGQVIVDEVHNGFLTPHFKSQMSKALRWYLKTHEVPRVLLLSATVYSSSPWNIFNLAFLTGHKWNREQFERTFFVYVRMGRRMIPKVRKGMEKRLAEATKKIASVVNIHDVLDVPLQFHAEPEYFSLNRKQEEEIQENYNPVPIVRYTKQHEIENGILIGNEYMPDAQFPCDKHERILALVEENPKIAIICRYNLQIDALATLLASHSPYVIRGDVKDRDAITIEVENKKRAIVLIQADCSMGYQLPSFELCVFASMSYSYVNKEQMEGRFLRMDKPSRTTFMYLLTEGDSIDKAVYDCLTLKKDFQINLFKK